MKYLIAVFFFFLFTFSHKAYAESSYVLPYPGIMPGNKLYVPNQRLQTVQGHLAFGDFSQFKYNLERSDQALVEAKTLFEYDQYPLALAALNRSNFYFKKIYPSLLTAQKNGKKVSDKKDIYEQARLKHLEVLQDIKLDLPEVFIWRAEKKPPMTLQLGNAIEQSTKLRHGK